MSSDETEGQWRGKEGMAMSDRPRDPPHFTKSEGTQRGWELLDVAKRSVTMRSNRLDGWLGGGVVSA